MFMGLELVTSRAFYGHKLSANFGEVRDGSVQGLMVINRFSTAMSVTVYRLVANLFSFLIEWVVMVVSCMVLDNI